MPTTPRAPTAPRRSLALPLALAWTPPAGHLPLGRPDLAETCEVGEVAPGIVHWRIGRGQPNPQDTAGVAVSPPLIRR